jgi:hypothetical protein
MNRDLMNNVHIIRAISPVVVTDNTAQVSEIIDTYGYNSLTFAIATGTLSDADATVVALVEDGDSATLTDAAAVADAQLLGTEALAGLTFADDNETRKIGYVGNKRYVRLTLTPANNTGNIPVSAVAVLGHPMHAPTANPPV